MNDERTVLEKVGVGAGRGGRTYAFTGHGFYDVVRPAQLHNASSMVPNSWLLHSSFDAVYRLPIPRCSTKYPTDLSLGHIMEQ